MRSVFVQLRYVTKEYKDLNLHHVQYPTETGWKTTTTTEELEREIFKQ